MYFFKHTSISLFFILLISMLIIAGCGNSGATSVDGDIVPPDCVNDDECPSGYVCNFTINLCEKAGGGDTSACENTCESDDDCDAGQVCRLDTDCNAKICNSTVVDGDAVDGDQDTVITPKCPTMIISPDQLDFGAVSNGSESNREFTILNDSNFNVDLVIDAIYYDEIMQTGEFQIIQQPEEYPLVLARGQSTTIKVKYTPIDPGIDEADIVVVSNACENFTAKVHLFSRYKGTAYACADPVGKNFGNVDLGSTAVVQPFKICNCGDLTGNKLLTVYEIRLASGHNENYTIISGAVDPYEPKYLTPGGVDPGDKACHTFEVQYVPQSPATTFFPHVERILIVNNSDDDSEQVIEINLTGTAQSSLLSIYPMPVDFGATIINTVERPNTECENDEDCPGDQKCFKEDLGSNFYCYAEQTVLINNWSANDIAITRIQLTPMDDRGDTGCEEFSFDDYIPLANRPCSDLEASTDCKNGTEETGLICKLDKPDIPTSGMCNIPFGGTVTGPFNVRYRPVDVGEDKCTLRIFSTLPDAGAIMSFSVIGTGRPANKPPIARVALQSHGSAITQRITGIAIGTELCFYGNISKDEDGTLLSPFSWDFPEMPEGSQVRQGSYYLPDDSKKHNMCTTFDKSGEYKITLKVQDTEGLWSPPFTINIDVNGDQALGLLLNFEGGSTGLINANLVDFDLILEDVIGGSCSDDNLSSGSCSFPLGHGYVTMPQYSMGAGFSGTTEEMRVFYPVDGPWYIKIEYEEDCENLLDILIQPICMSRLKNNDYTLEIYDPNDWESTTPLFPIIHGQLSSKGDVDTYRIVRVGGVWGEPIKMN